jgi:membrane protease YdiL (CAAX protease family)
MRRLAEGYPAATFIALAYLLSWVLWIPGVLLFRAQPEPTLEPGPVLLVLAGTYGPTFAAFVLTGLRRGRPGVRELARRYLAWSGAGWFLLAFLLPVLVFLGGLLGRVLLGAELPGPFWERLSLAAFLGRVAFALPFGPLGEEAGWRGYLLPALQRRQSAFAASIVVGVVWTLWHIPMFWVPGAALPPSVGLSVGAVGIYLLGVTATSVIATALYNSTSGSLLVAVIYHLATNLWHQVLAPVFIGEATAAWADLRLPALAANWVAALALTVRLGPRALSRRGKVIQ